MAKTLTPQQGLDKVGLTTETVVKRIMRAFYKASEAEFVLGLCWYNDAQYIVNTLAADSQYTVNQIAAAMAHLSPRLRWKQNVDSIEQLVLLGKVPNYVMSGPAKRAEAALQAANPELTFGKKALKTLNFSRNVSGCANSVTVDVWAARLCGVSEAQLKLVGVYDALAHCFRLAAKRAGVTPAQIQAITWIVVRGSAD